VNKQKRFEELLKKKGIHVPKGPVLSRGDQAGPFKLSFAQRRIWFLQQFDTDSAAYSDPTALRIKGKLDISAAERTFNEIIRRHNILQVNFRAREGQPVQVLNEKNKKITIPVIPLEKAPGTPVPDRVREWVNHYSKQPFDLSKDQLLRVILLKIDQEDHALLVNPHHIVVDGWSKGIMLEEMIALYEAFSQGRPSPLGELPIQYTDYVRWHHEWMQGKLFESQLNYWKERLAGAPPVLELPTDHPRPGIPTGRGTLQPFSLPRETFQDLIALARREDVTLFMLLLAAFNTLLHRYSGEEDILVGSPIAGRQRVELENLIGLFLNTLVLRTDLSGDPTFKALLQRVRSMALEAYAHQDMPFEKLVEELNPERDLSVTPLFQVMFQLQNAPMPPVNISGLSISPIQLDTGFAQVDLSLTMWEEQGILKGTFEYSTDLFEDETIIRMIGCYLNLLDGMIANPDRKLSQLPMLSEAETHTILVEWNDTEVDYPDDLCIYQLFESCVEKNPGKEAVMINGGQLTYRELNEQANRLAHFLRKMKVGPETLVGICMENSLELFIGIMGILKAGSAYIPMDPEYPDERLMRILKDSRPPVLLTLTSHLSRFDVQAFKGEIVCLDSEKDSIAGESKGAHSNRCRPHHAACVIYTSGSTGEPKGIIIENRNIVNLVYSFFHSYTPGPADNILPLTSIASASFVGEILPILTSGGAVILADKVHFLDMKKLAALLSRYEITILSTVPSMIARLNMLDPDEWKPGKLRLLLSGGEALSAGDIDFLKETVTIVNGYGLTEATICSTYNILNTSKYPVISVGKPIINTQVYILDTHLNPVPIGVPGEIYIGGDGLARGYLNNQEMTAERFNRSYKSYRTYISFKTGDLGSWLPDGTIKFLGRIDTQVQIHGHRIELAEVENNLGLHPDIRDVVVIDRELKAGDRRLVAYVVTRNENGREFTSSEWREWLSKRIPEYMIPTVFETLDTIPLNANGKVDVKALPVPSGVRPQLDVAFKAPRTEIENEIASVWQEFLHVEKVGVDDNFFDLGGHSLLLTQVHARLNKIYEGKKELTIVDLFRYPTVLSLAKFIGETQNKSTPEVYKKIQERVNKQRQVYNRPPPKRRKNT
jgi:amino acid adenylation domain-containing protein